MKKIGQGTIQKNQVNAIGKNNINKSSNKNIEIKSKQNYRFIYHKDEYTTNTCFFNIKRKNKNKNNSEDKKVIIEKMIIKNKKKEKIENSITIMLKMNQILLIVQKKISTLNSPIMLL